MPATGTVHEMSAAPVEAVALLTASPSVFSLTRVAPRFASTPTIFLTISVAASRAGPALDRQIVVDDNGGVVAAPLPCHSGRRAWIASAPRRMARLRSQSAMAWIQVSTMTMAHGARSTEPSISKLDGAMAVKNEIDRCARKLVRHSLLHQREHMIASSIVGAHGAFVVGDRFHPCPHPFRAGAGAAASAHQLF